MLLDYVRAEARTYPDTKKAKWNRLPFCFRLFKTPNARIQYSRNCFFFFDFESDVPGVTTGVFDEDFAVAPLDYGGKLFSPFHQQNRVFGRHLIESDRLQLALVSDAIEIDVVK